MWDRLADYLWSLGRGPHNIWLEELWEHLLSAVITYPVAFEKGIFCCTGSLC